MKRKIIIIITLIIVIIISIFLLIGNKKDIKNYQPSIKFSSEKKDILEGNSELLSLIRININGTISFSSSDDTIVLVNDTGIIKGLKPGVAIITVTYKDEKNMLTDFVEITVKPKYNSTLFGINHEIISGIDGWNNKNVIAKAVINNENNNVGIDVVKYSINCPGVNCDSNVLTDNYEFIISQEGKNNILIEAVDAMGTTVSDSFEVLIDKSNPLINYSINNGTYHENKNVSINVSDSISGIKSFDVNVYRNGLKDANLSKSGIVASNYSVNLNSDATWKIETIVTDNASNSKTENKTYVIDVMSYREGPGGDRFKKTITYKNRTYIIYDQFAYKDIKFWGGDIASSGCGPTSLAIALSAFDPSITPIKTAQIMRSGTFDRIKYALKQLGYSDDGIIYYNSNYPDAAKVQSTMNEVRAHLNKGYPLIVLVTHYYEGNTTYNNCGGPYKYAETNHFMAVLGEKPNGELIIGNSGGGAQTGTLEEIIRCYLGGGAKGFLKIIPVKR